MSGGLSTIKSTTPASENPENDSTARNDGAGLVSNADTDEMRVPSESTAAISLGRAGADECVPKETQQSNSSCSESDPNVQSAVASRKESSYEPACTELIRRGMQDDNVYQENIQGVGLLLERGVLRREDDFGGHEVKRKSLIASSQLTIMHSADPTIPALPAVPGSEAWNQLRQEYLYDKERILREQHVEAASSLKSLMTTIRGGSDLPSQRGPPSVYTYYERLQRLFAALNRTVSPLFSGRQRNSFLDDLCPAPQLSDGTFDQEFLPPWLEQAKRAISKAVAAIDKQSLLLGDIISDVAEESNMSSSERAWSLENQYDTYFARNADPKSCSTLLECIELCSNAFLGRGIFGFAVPNLPTRQENPEEEPCTTSSSTALSFSRMLLPDTWQLVSKAPLFRGSVDGFDLMHEIASKLQPLLFADQALIIKQGTIGMSMYFVNAGSCSVQGNGSTLATRVPGEFFGEIALTMAQERMADVFAEGSCELFELRRQDFREIIKKFPHVYKRIAAVGTARVNRENWHDRLSESGRVELLDDNELRQCADDLHEVNECLERSQSVVSAGASEGAVRKVELSDAKSRDSSRPDPASEWMSKFIETLILTSGVDSGYEELAEMWSCLTFYLQRKQVAPSSAFCSLGDACSSFYIVESGECIATVDSREIKRLGPGGFFGEIALVLSGTFACDITSGEEGVSLLELTKADLLIVIDSYPLLFELLKDQAAVSYNLIHFGDQ